MKYTYQEMGKILEKYYNDTNYCGVMSLCTATGLSVGKSYHLLNKHGRQKRKGTPWVSMVNALEEAGYSLISLRGERMTAQGKWCYRNSDCAGIATYGQAIKQLTVGTYLILNVTSASAHVGCLKDGVLNDWTVGSKRKTVRAIYRVVKTEEIR